MFEAFGFLCTGLNCGVVGYEKTLELKPSSLEAICFLSKVTAKVFSCSDLAKR